jgi:magnesium-transporting ATPase (P-type)
MRFASGIRVSVSPVLAAWLLTAFASTVPQDYDDLLSYYTKRGYRVIAVAGKSIEGLSWLKAQRMKR